MEKDTQHQLRQAGGRLTDEARHHTTNRRRNTEQVGDSRGIQEFVLEDASALQSRRPEHDCLTGTFFWIMTTTVSLPRTEMEVCPEPEIALNAYSEWYQMMWTQSRASGETYRLGIDDLPVKTP